MTTTMIIPGSLKQYEELFCYKLLTLSWFSKMLLDLCSSLPVIEIRFDFLWVSCRNTPAAFAYLLLSASSNLETSPKNSKSIELISIKCLIRFYAITSTYIAVFLTVHHELTIY